MSPSEIMLLSSYSCSLEINPSFIAVECTQLNWEVAGSTMGFYTGKLTQFIKVVK